MNEVNAATSAAVSERAFEIVCEQLERYGNRLGSLHREALRQLAAGLTQLAFGELKGRLAFPLNCGLGKTQSVIAFCAALSQLQCSHIGVAVAASKVEALCEVKRDMI